MPHAKAQGTPRRGEGGRFDGLSVPAYGQRIKPTGAGSATGGMGERESFDKINGMHGMNGMESQGEAWPGMPTALLSLKMLR